MARAVALPLVLALAGCGAAASSVPLPAARPELVAEHAPELVFADPARRSKLERAFPAIDALVRAEAKDHGLAGIALGVVIDGELAHFASAGFADIDTHAPPTPDTVYRIGSITKSFTALGILALRDDGVLGLDDPLARFIPEAARLVAPTSDSPPVTLRELLTHTAGLPRSGAYEIAGVPEPSENTITASLPGYALEYVPGTRVAYSNLGFQLLGLVIRRASKTPLRSFMAARIFGPLGMSSTSFDGSGLLPGQLAVGYDKNARGALVPVPVGRHGAMESAGGIFSSVRDMARYVAFHLAADPPRSAPDTGPVRRSSVREAHFNALRSAPMSVHLKSAAAKGETAVSARVTSYAYALGVIESCELDELVTHNGGLPGYSTAISFLPRRGVGIVALTNQGKGGRDPSGLAERALLALQKTGGLQPRVLRPVLPPALDAAMARLLAVYDRWDPAAYHAMLSPHRGPVTEEEERLELAGYKALHGACRAYAPVEVHGAGEAKIAMQCDRGALEMGLTVDKSGLILGFAGTSTGVPAPEPFARAASRLAGLIERWDDAVYDRILGGNASKTRAERAAFFDGLRAAHGACAPGGYKRAPDKQEMTLACARGGDVRLELKLSAEDEEAVASFAILETPAVGACPVK